MEKLEQIWTEHKPKDGLNHRLNDLKTLLQRKDPVTRTTTMMLMCRFTPHSSSIIVRYICFSNGSYCFRFGNEELLARILNLLKIANQGITSFPETLQVTLFEKDRSGLTALHHAVRSCNKLVVRWRMQTTALAMPGHYDIEDADPQEDEKRFNMKSLISDGASQQTKAALWE